MNNFDRLIIVIGFIVISSGFIFLNTDIKEIKESQKKCNLIFIGEE